MSNKWTTKWTTKWRLRWYHIVLAIGLLVVLFAAHPASREFSNKLRTQWGWKHHNSDFPLSHEGGVWYKDDIPYRLPEFDIGALKQKRPHHYKGPGHFTFATFYATRNATEHDPYFIAAQQIVYRLLWDPHIKSAGYPVTVFVAPFVPHDKREYFAAAGAIVRELPLYGFEAVGDEKLDERYLDVMSKLYMWNQTEFSRIAFLDGDAFPWVNIDHMMGPELSPEQKCKSDLLDEDGKIILSSPDACDYVFSAYTEAWDQHEINAGVMVLKPHEEICNMLFHLSEDQSAYDNRYPEQGPLTLFYHPDGAFPSSHLSRGWNGEPDRIRNPEVDSYIVHSRIWLPFWGGDNFVTEDFNATWLAMLDLYEGQRFVQLRDEDDSVEDLWPGVEQDPAAKGFESGWPFVTDTEEEETTE